MSFEVLTTVNMSVMVFWVVMSYSPTSPYDVTTQKTDTDVVPL
jgi:hypothetical protein